MQIVPQYSDIQFGFDIRTPASVDRRLLLTAEEMESGKVYWLQDPADPSLYHEIDLVNIMPEHYICQCVDDGKLYYYDKNADVIDPNEYWHGKFKLITKVLDVKAEELDSEGREISLVDADGIVHIYTNAKKDIQTLEFVIQQLDSRTIKQGEQIKLKADKFELNSEAERAVAAEAFLQQQITYLGDGPYIDEDWVSAYDVGGVAKYQAFKKGTSIKEIVRQILNGDPREDGIIFYATMDALPVYMKDVTWSMQLIDRSELAAHGFEIDHQVVNNKILVLALPRAMIKNVGTEVDSEGHHIEVNPVELVSIFAPATPEFKYDWSYIDIKRDSFNTEWGYRLYFPCHRDAEGKAIPSKSTGDISRCYTFKHHEPGAPDPAKLGGQR